MRNENNNFIRDNEYLRIEHAYTDDSMPDASGQLLLAMNKALILLINEDQVFSRIYYYSSEDHDEEWHSYQFDIDNQMKRFFTKINNNIKNKYNTPQSLSGIYRGGYCKTNFLRSYI